jgi:hypothetical protein
MFTGRLQELKNDMDFIEHLYFSPQEISCNKMSLAPRSLNVLNGICGRCGLTIRFIIIVPSYISFGYDLLG